MSKYKTRNGPAKAAVGLNGSAWQTATEPSITDNSLENSSKNKREREKKRKHKTHDRVPVTD